MANLPLPKTGAALVAAMAGVSDVIKSKGVHLEHPEDIFALPGHQHALSWTGSRRVHSADLPASGRDRP